MLHSIYGNLPKVDSIHCARPYKMSTNEAISERGMYISHKYLKYVHTTIGRGYACQRSKIVVIY